MGKSIDEFNDYRCKFNNRIMESADLDELTF